MKSKCQTNFKYNTCREYRYVEEIKKYHIIQFQIKKIKKQFTQKKQINFINKKC